LCQQGSRKSGLGSFLQAAAVAVAPLGLKAVPHKPAAVVERPGFQCFSLSL
jgi:hypothetical protein